MRKKKSQKQMDREAGSEKEHKMNIEERIADAGKAHKEKARAVLASLYQEVRREDLVNEKKYWIRFASPPLLSSDLSSGLFVFFAPKGAKFYNQILTPDEVGGG